jgi:hypothetical protein
MQNSLEARRPPFNLPLFQLPAVHARHERSTRLPRRAERVHPDRFVSATAPKARRHAMGHPRQRSLPDLKIPQKRAQYLCELWRRFADRVEYGHAVAS